MVEEQPEASKSVSLREGIRKIVLESQQEQIENLRQEIVRDLEARLKEIVAGQPPGPDGLVERLERALDEEARIAAIQAGAKSKEEFAKTLEPEIDSYRKKLNDILDSFKTFDIKAFQGSIMQQFDAIVKNNAAFEENVGIKLKEMENRMSTLALMEKQLEEVRTKLDDVAAELRSVELSKPVIIE
ncbi:MAG: hypothetical protein HY519_00525 [Candidatus Aenigmarchaeota archaeon]|nr:hypothetical protein [Candidatus Aenigmarchaeota archaeon]